MRGRAAKKIGRGVVGGGGRPEKEVGSDMYRGHRCNPSPLVQWLHNWWDREFL